MLLYRNGRSKLLTKPPHVSPQGRISGTLIATYPGDEGGEPLGLAPLLQGADRQPLPAAFAQCVFRPWAESA